MLAAVFPSTKEGKKYTVVLYDQGNIDIVNFGASGYEDYTMHQDITRKKNYIIRHHDNENWNDPRTAGFWSKNLLWNKKTIKASANDIQKKYKMKVMLVD